MSMSRDERRESRVDSIRRRLVGLEIDVEKKSEIRCQDEDEGVDDPNGRGQKQSKREASNSLCQHAQTRNEGLKGHSKDAKGRGGGVKAQPQGKPPNNEISRALTAIFSSVLEMTWTIPRYKSSLLSSVHRLRKQGPRKPSPR